MIFAFQSRRGKQIDILNHINLTVPDGKLVVITGPNGSKSTWPGSLWAWKGHHFRHHHLQRSAGAGSGVTERAKLGISYGFQQPARFKGA